MPKNYRKLERDRLRLLQAQAAEKQAKQNPQKPAKSWWRKRRRITDGLIGISSAAILAVYSVGYLNTQRVEGDFVVNATPPASVSASSSNHGPLVLAGTPTPGAEQVGYRDGTYVGRGSSRHGDIEATVVIQGGQIVSADVSACGTRYSCRYMRPLIAEVINSQDAPVDHVSGASDSSKAYTEAVQAALSQAS